MIVSVYLTKCTATKTVFFPKSQHMIIDEYTHSENVIIQNMSHYTVMLFETPLTLHCNLIW